LAGAVSDVTVEVEDLLECFVVDGPFPAVWDVKLGEGNGLGEYVFEAGFEVSPGGDNDVLFPAYTSAMEDWWRWWGVASAVGDEVMPIPHEVSDFGALVGCPFGGVSVGAGVGLASFGAGWCGECA
jgi:hypothetical protein